MTYTAEINVMPLKELLDPQGKAVNSGLKNLGITEAKDVRIGKHIIIKIDAASQEQAKEKVELACKKLLANQVMEFYEYSIHE
jgi:phosphoribosylformylglycinamidine synthase